MQSLTRASPKLVKVIEPEVLAARTGYAAPHTVHCGPEASTCTPSASPDGDGPGGIFIMDPETFRYPWQWEIDRGPQ